MGPQSGKLVPCERSPYHCHHPEREPCPECPTEPQELEDDLQPPNSWPAIGYEFDLDGYYWP
jgi:hypothetical protein